MQFLDQLEPGERERLRAAARSLELARGAHLVRRGEAGGDLFLVEEGAVEVVDTRSRPEVVLDVVGPGTLVGDMTFLDGSTRTADVRAASDARLLRWDRGVLAQVLAEDLGLAVAFYRAMSLIMVDRVRAVTTSAMTGGLGRPRSGQTMTMTGPAMAREAYDLAETARARWTESEARLRVDPTDVAARANVRKAAEALLKDAQAWLGRVPDATRLPEAGQVLARELHAFLVRARTVALAWESANRHGPRAEIIAHAVRGVALGEGALGEALDAALLAHPTPTALRWRVGVAPVLAARGPAARTSGTDRRAPALIVNGAASGFPARFIEAWNGFRGGALDLMCVEESRELLARIEPPSSKRGLAEVPSGPVDVRRVQDDMAALALGHSRLHVPPQAVIAIDGLVEYLPERLVAALFGWCRERLYPGGGIVVTALAPSNDAAIFDHVLEWPTVRRPAQVVGSLLSTAGFSKIQLHAEGAGVVVTGVRRADEASSRG